MASAPPRNAYSMYQTPQSQTTPMAISQRTSSATGAAAALAPASYSTSASPARTTSGSYHASSAGGGVGGPHLAAIKPRRTVSSQGTITASQIVPGRRRAATVNKRPSPSTEDQPQVSGSLPNGARGMSPATLTSHNLHKMTLGNGDDDEEEMLVDGDDDGVSTNGSNSGNVPGARKSRSKKEKGQTFQCEKCSKVYRHPQCLIKHRWEHTQYWKEASKLMLSKHQQVQMLEAAAILFSPPQSLPTEKALWPAAVSPPTSGLLGSEKLNFETIRRSGTPGISSSLGTSWTRSTSHDSESNNERDDDDEDEEDYASPETDPDQDIDIDGDEAMFKVDDIDDMGSSEERDSGYASGSVRSGTAPKVNRQATLKPEMGNFGNGPAQGHNKVALAVSAPPMGFFNNQTSSYQGYGQFGRGRR